MPMLLAGLLLLWLSSYLLRGFLRSNPAVLSRRLRKAGGWAALLFALVTLFRGEFNFAFGAAMFGMWLLGTEPGWAGKAFGSTGRGSFFSGGQRAPLSRVRTASLEMSLDQATGRIYGRGLRGPAAGRFLDDLSEAECVAFYRWCGFADQQGARLLETYLDRRFAAWREAGNPTGNAGARGGAGRARKAAGMSEHEACQVLGLPESAAKDEITQAHRRLMKKFHPDHGGTTAMAARINEAKDVLMRRHP